MQSYKMRKTSETVLYPIEDELRKIRKENNKSWRTLLWQIFSVVFSGIGTTLLSQENYIPRLTKYMIYEFTGQQMIEEKNDFLMFILESLFAIIVFSLICLLFNAIIFICSNRIDNKSSYKERRNLAEYFHKVIFNNIITGISFVKKAKLCQNKIREKYDDKDKDVKKRHEEERDLYISEAIYYFRVANQQINDKHIFEHSFRDKYEKFLKEVGVVTLDNCLIMYDNAVVELKKLNEDHRNDKVILEIQEEYLKYRNNYNDSLKKFNCEKKKENNEEYLK